MLRRSFNHCIPSAELILSWGKIFSEYRSKIKEAERRGDTVQAANTVDNLVFKRDNHYANEYETIICKIDIDGKKLLNEGTAFAPVKEIYCAITEAFLVAEKISFSIGSITHDYLGAQRGGYHDIKAGTYHPSNKVIEIRRRWREKYISMPKSKEGRKHAALKKALENCQTQFDKMLNLQSEQL